MSLVDLYRHYHRGRASLDDKTTVGFFPPLLVSPPERWFSHKHRIAFVGQETLGWLWTKADTDIYGYPWDRPDISNLKDFFDLESSVNDLMHGYQLFDYARHQPLNSRGPFWRYFKKTLEFFESDTASALFSNVVRCATDHEFGFTLWTVDKETRHSYMSWQSGLLRAELVELRPTFIIFVSGPYYDDYLKGEFPDLKFEAFTSFPERVLARLSSDALPATAYRTYHPGFLNRSHKFLPIEMALHDYQARTHK